MENAVPLLFMPAFTRVAILCLSLLFLPSVPHAGFYTWKDKAGTVHFTDSYDAIPASYREGVQQSGRERDTAAGTLDTDTPRRVVIHFEREDNAIVVQTVLNWKLPVFFQLDTGASCTMITREDALALGLDMDDRPAVKGYVADGSLVELKRAMLSSLAVGGAEVHDLEVVIGKMRLLGMDFLREFHLTVDAVGGQLVLERKDGDKERETPSVTREKTRARDELENQLVQIELAINARNTYIEELRSDIRDSVEKKAQVESALSEARQRTRFESSDISFDASTRRSIEKHEDVKARLDRHIEMRKNELAIQQKQVEQLQGKMDYYQSLI